MGEQIEPESSIAIHTLTSTAGEHVGSCEVLGIKLGAPLGSRLGTELGRELGERLG